MSAPAEARSDTPTHARVSAHSSVPRSGRGRDSPALDDALIFIETHFAEAVRLEQLAALSALSISRFVTVFRQRFGRSPYRYLCDVRILHAQTLLLAGMPGSVVATEVGFFDQSHFGRHFKRFCGMTPGGYVRSCLDS